MYSADATPALVGVPLPGRRRGAEGSPLAAGRVAPAAHSVAGMLDPARQPQTLEELLERHWEQVSSSAVGISCTYCVFLVACFSFVLKIVSLVDSQPVYRVPGS